MISLEKYPFLYRHNTYIFKWQSCVSITIWIWRQSYYLHTPPPTYISLFRWTVRCICWSTAKSSPSRPTWSPTSRTCNPSRCWRYTGARWVITLVMELFSRRRWTTGWTQTVKHVWNYPMHVLHIFLGLTLTQQYSAWTDPAFISFN